MTESKLKRALNQAEMVRYADSAPIFVVWSGGTTYNVYSEYDDRLSAIHEVDVFSACDDEGKPYPREDAEVLIQGYLERQEARV